MSVATQANEALERTGRRPAHYGPVTACGPPLNARAFGCFMVRHGER